MSFTVRPPAPFAQEVRDGVVTYLRLKADQLERFYRAPFSAAIHRECADELERRHVCADALRELRATMRRREAVLRARGEWRQNPLRDRLLIRRWSEGYGIDASDFEWPLFGPRGALP